MTYGNADIHVADRLAGPVAIRALRAEYGRAADEVEALMRVSAAAADAYRLEDVMEQAAEAALEVTGAASLSISRWEREPDALRTLINVGWIGPGEERFPAEELYRLGDYPLVARLLREAKPYWSAVDDPDAPQAAIDLLRANGKESEVAVPIVLDGRVWGEVWATTAVGAPRFDESDTRFLQAIADRLALVLGRAERYSRVSRLAYEDPLTGLANRRAIEERLDALLDPGSPVGASLTLLLCDVDALKDVNDVHGHYAGDRALCLVADSLIAATGAVRAPFVGRLGGDEFCVLLEDASLETAGDVAATALKLLAEADDLPLSLSFGAAVATSGMGAADLLRAADGAQYAAKRRGGGRLCTASSEALTGMAPATLVPRDVEQGIERAAQEALGILDADLAGSPAVDRIEAVAGALSGALNAAGWALSSWERGSPVLRTIATADDRASRLRGARMGLDQRTCRLADFPETARLLAKGNGSFLVRDDDVGGDAAERRLLREMGFSAGLLIGVGHATGSYLLELYADGESAELAPAAIRAQLLARVAAAVPGAS